jgi:NAD+ synthetase
VTIRPDREQRVPGQVVAGLTKSELLQRVRWARGFDAHEVAEAKLGRLARFFGENALDAAVVGVSGGVDSALVLALLQELVRRNVLKRVVALLLPVAGRGATRQGEATVAGRLVAAALGAEVWEAPLGDAQAAVVSSLAQASRLPFTPWAEGQALSVVRTPALYGAAALLQAHGFRSLVVGTTNRDEGSYLGFFGKASDGMVDLQPISDLHKSEVRSLARLLGVPGAIVEAVPSGDVYDGRTDEQMLHASYDDVELFLRLRELGLSELSPPDLDQRALEEQHAVNRHKYRVGSPAVHLDVLVRGVPGGWTSEVLAPRTEQRPPAEAVPASWEPPHIPLDAPVLPDATALPISGFALSVEGVLSRRDCERLQASMAASARAEPVGVTGVRGSYGVGSFRATAWSQALASSLWRRLASVVPSVRFLDERAPTEAFATATRTGHRAWRVVGLSPLLRFMRYEPGGRHWCHYDAGYDYGDGRRTLLSVVFYLSDASSGGATRFVRDGQEHLPVSARDFADWTRDARDDEVVAAVQPRAGSALIFDHRLCHDVQLWPGPGPRVIIRADVVYEAIPDGRS